MFIKYHVSDLMLKVVQFCQCLNFQERSRILLRFADLVEKHNDEIAALETWNNGKPYEQAAKGEVPMLARLFRYYAGEIERESIDTVNSRFSFVLLVLCL